MYKFSIKGNRTITLQEIGDNGGSNALKARIAQAFGQEIVLDERAVEVIVNQDMEYFWIAAHFFKDFETFQRDVEDCRNDYYEFARPYIEEYERFMSVRENRTCERVQQARKQLDETLQVFVERLRETIVSLFLEAATK